MTQHNLPELLEVAGRLLELADIVNRAVDDWGESFADGSSNVKFHKDEADKLTEILEYFDDLPEGPDERVIESGPTKAARIIRAALSSQGAGETVGYLVSIDDEPELGDWFSKDDCSQHGYTCKPLYTRPQAVHPALVEALKLRGFRTDGDVVALAASVLKEDADVISGQRSLLEAQPARVIDDLLERCAKWCDDQAASDWYGRKASEMVRAFAKCGQLSTPPAAPSICGMPVVVDESMPAGQIEFVQPTAAPTPSQAGAVTELEVQLADALTDCVEDSDAEERRMIECGYGRLYRPQKLEAQTKVVRSGRAALAAYEAKKAGVCDAH